MHKILLVDDGSASGELVQQAAKAAGHQVVMRVRPEQDLVSHLEAGQMPSVLIACLPEVDNTILQQMTSINHVAPLPVVLFVQRNIPGIAAEVTKSGVSSYIVDGLVASRVEAIIDVAVARFTQMQSLRKELIETRRALQDRKTIDRAKGIIMKHRSCSEDEAYGVLRKEAMDSNQRIAMVAERVINTAQLFG